MTHVSLFSGIGGFDLAAEWAGFETVLQVEMDDYATRVLEKYWPDVKRIKDIRDVNRDSVTESVTVVSGGFPCQPFSQAGRRRGTKDDRYLWPEMLRVIRELSPAWVVGENVSGLLSLNDGMEFETIATDLEDAGYEVLPLHYPAAGVGAPHRRDRVFVVANNSSKRYDRKKKTKQEIDGGWSGVFMGAPSEIRWGLEWQKVASRVWGMANGVPHWVDRLKCLGNAVVPQQAYPIFKAIAEVEEL
jgi:DNA (cytosine-5)-methyltransferase 1